MEGMGFGNPDDPQFISAFTTVRAAEKQQQRKEFINQQKEDLNL